MTELLEDALRRVAILPKEEQDAIASQIIETLQDEAAWKEKLARDPLNCVVSPKRPSERHAVARLVRSMRFCDRQD